MRISRWGGAAVAGAAVVLALAGPAQAQGDWSANGDSEIVDSTTVRLQGDNTSIETGNLGVNVDAGDEISFRYDLQDGALCVGGGPRVFVIINGANTNSWDQLQPAGEQCGVDGLVTFAAGNAGLITTAGVVYDNGAGGAVEVSDLTIAGEPVLFQDPPAPAPEPEPSPTTEPGPDPTGEPSPDPAAPGQGGGDDKPGLPVTGASLPVLVGGGAALAAAGGGLWWLARRRRVSFTA